MKSNRVVTEPMNHYSYITSHIVQVKVPVPFSLKWVNSYLIFDASGKFSIIDPGLRTAEAEQVWAHTLTELSLTWSDCTLIVVTHQHPDHYGLAGYVQERSHAPVYMTREAKAYADKLWGTGQQQFESDMKALLASHAVPAAIVAAILENMREFQERVEPQPEVIYVEAGDTISLGDVDWLLIHTEGHAYGGIMLYEPGSKLLLCGDQVLPHITPHVGVVAGEDRPVLSQFLTNLKQIVALDVSMVLPGHREPFEGFAERIEKIVKHHERRLQAICTYVQEQGIVDAFTCCEWLFGKHLRDQPHNMRFALTETIAHLAYLQEQGQLQVRLNEKGIYQYTIADRT